ncbi:putative 4-amino-4-deoxy-L-arabinose-phosphoundecaprenol flippase subunit ArnE [Camelimonas fluminis]|uniref:EamA family transporter n=1 Tax=Camelimonas fluminis TaxID=1576911 RepID=A0ABV7UHF3_9HYPH|nr:EamA family transporter [Camelimonas fluminis]GHE72672.1 putative 4-amino-4-deoxy-L-arabinose-phosphoundecaprenol flippase subunit ArnE [Camelimonas fluminis]
MMLALWFALSVLADVAGQICFKRGADALPDDAPGAAMVWPLLHSGWVMAGVLVYTAEIFIWLRILAETPLSVAFPIASLNFLAITLGSVLLLGEKVNRRQWLGAVLVTAGVIVVARGA